MGAYESPIHELSYAVLLVSILQVFSEIWQDDYRSVGLSWDSSPPLFPSVALVAELSLLEDRHWETGGNCPRLPEREPAAIRGLFGIIRLVRGIKRLRKPF